MGAYGSPELPDRPAQLSWRKPTGHRRAFWRGFRAGLLAGMLLAFVLIFGLVVAATNGSVQP